MPSSSGVDVLIVGGGPAGLSAALVLGRALRTVLVCDHGRPRNAHAREMHGFLTRDGMTPAELRTVAREQLSPYANVAVRDVEVTEVDRGFTFTLADGSTGTARRVLLATGVVDTLPRVEGFDALYGKSAFHCPFCDGWEVRGKAIAVLGDGPHGAGLALELLAWSRDLVLLTCGDATLDADQRARLAEQGIAVREEKVVRLEGGDGALERVVFEGGATLARDALFFCTGNHQASPLALRLGCGLDEKGAVRTEDDGRTDVPGVYVAGDASRRAQMVVIAAAEGALAAIALHHELAEEDLRSARPSPR